MQYELDMDKCIQSYSATLLKNVAKHSEAFRKKKEKRRNKKLFVINVESRMHLNEWETPNQTK